jgi:hypothetical protein
MSGRTTARRRIVVAGVTLVVVAAIGAGSVVAYRAIDNSSAEASDTDDETGQPAATSTAAVTRRNLEEREELSGTLGFGEQTEVSRNGEGTVTALPALGTVVDRGQTMVEVDGLAIPLWFGDRPLWRALDGNATDGADVQEVEANLVALGHATSATLTVDDDWTAATTTAVKKWQDALGREETGVIAPGDVVVQPGAVRIAAHPTPVGSPAGGPVAKVTTATRRVTVDLEATKQSLVAKDQPVKVELPDGTLLDATISSVGTVATAQDTGDPENPGEPTVEVVVALADPTQAGTLDEAPVSVQVVTSAASDVLAVPVDALLALAEGGYAVDRAAGDGGLVRVETGAFADGWVEITGDLAEGDEVVVPA